MSLKQLRFKETETHLIYDIDKIYSGLIEYTLYKNDNIPSESSVQDIVEGVLYAIQQE